MEAQRERYARVPGGGAQHSLRAGGGGRAKRRAPSQKKTLDVFFHATKDPNNVHHTILPEETP